MTKHLLISTLLTTAVLFSQAAGAAEVKKNAKLVSKPAQQAQHQNDKLRHEVSALHLRLHEQEKLHHETRQQLNSLLEDNKKARGVLVDSEGLSIKVGGDLTVQYGNIDQEIGAPGDKSNSRTAEDENPMQVSGIPSNFTNKRGFGYDGNLVFNAEKEHCGNKYGAELKLSTDDAPELKGNSIIARNAFIFAKTKLGEFEVGANAGASNTMAISGATIAKATGGIDGDYDNWVSYGSYGNTTPEGPVATYQNLTKTFLTSPALPYEGNNAKRSNKFTYYTPDVRGFKAGFSYVPDMTVQGTVSDLVTGPVKSGYKNVVEGGLSYEFNAKDDESANKEGLFFKASALGQTGKARDWMLPATAVSLNGLGTWQVGGQIGARGNDQDLSLAASYGDLGKSGTMKTKTNGAALGKDTKSRKQQFWSAGLAWTRHDDNKKEGLGHGAGVSLTYMESTARGKFSPTAYDYISKAGNEDIYNNSEQKFKALSLGGEWKAMAGFMPFAEVTHFKYGSDLSKTAAANTIKNNKGTVVLGGVKLSF